MNNEIDQLIDNAPWRASTLKGDHEYVMQEKAKTIVEQVLLENDFYIYVVAKYDKLYQ